MAKIITVLMMVLAWGAGAQTNAVAKVDTNAVAKAEAPKPAFTKQQVERRLRELKGLYERGLLTKEFYDRKVKECEVVE